MLFWGFEGGSFLPKSPYCSSVLEDDVATTGVNAGTGLKIICCSDAELSDDDDGVVGIAGSDDVDDDNGFSWLGSAGCVGVVETAIASDAVSSDDVVAVVGSDCCDDCCDGCCCW